jgi:L-lysine 2,3-aminomutase
MKYMTTLTAYTTAGRRDIMITNQRTDETAQLDHAIATLDALRSMPALTDKEREAVEKCQHALALAALRVEEAGIA